MKDGLPTDVADWFQAAVGPGWAIRQVEPLEASSSTVLAVRHHGVAPR